MVFLMIVSIFAGYLAAPPSTEGLWVFGYIFEVLCEECRGNWRTCCERLCYDDMVRKTHTDGFDSDKYQLCVNNCVTGLAGMCRFY
jgi:hypothetical protein